MAHLPPPLARRATTPATTYPYQLWADTTTNTVKRRNAANSAWIVLRTLDETFVLARASNTILALSDIGKTIKATSTFTQTLTAAATLGDGWFINYRNDGTGIITLDPNASETIDGSTTVKLLPGESCTIYCDGSNFKTIGRGYIGRDFDALSNYTLAASVAGNALTIALKDKNGDDPSAASPVATARFPSSQTIALSNGLKPVIPPGASRTSWTATGFSRRRSRTTASDRPRNHARVVQQAPATQGMAARELRAERHLPPAPGCLPTLAGVLVATFVYSTGIAVISP